MIRLEKEIRQKIAGPVLHWFNHNRIFINPIALAEFLSYGKTAARFKFVQAFDRLQIQWEDGIQAAHLRHQRAKQGRPLTVPDAFMAASAINNKLRLLTSDKDFSWFARRAEAKQRLSYASGFATGTCNPFYLATGGRSVMFSKIKDDQPILSLNRLLNGDCNMTFYRQARHPLPTAGLQ
jgi:predicted nucleic acid-binding protein